MASQNKNKIKAEPKSGCSKTKTINTKNPLPASKRCFSGLIFIEAEEK